MAQIISASEFAAGNARPKDDFLSVVTPLTVRDFMEHACIPSRPSRVRPVCLADTTAVEAPQSQVDQLISDLMDIIVRASGAVEKSTPADSPKASGKSRDAVAEVVALTMMQALLDKQVCSSF